jgi:hypothetical protein
VYSLHELEVVDGISPQRWCERHCELFKVVQILPKVDARDIVHDIQQSHASTSIASRLR